MAFISQELNRCLCDMEHIAVARIGTWDLKQCLSIVGLVEYYYSEVGFFGTWECEWTLLLAL